MITLCVEIQKFVRVANVFFTTKGKELTPTTLTIEKDKFILLFSEGNKVISFQVSLTNLPNLILEPTTLSNLSGRVVEHISSKELHYRVNVLSEDPDFTWPKQTLSGRERDHNEIKFCFCANCNFNIGTVNFDRIVDLPSADWRELASEWFCHKHSHDSNGEENDHLNTLTFKKSDFVTASTRVYFQKGCLESGDFIIPEEGDIICPRCFSSLGNVQASPLNTGKTVKTDNIYCCFSKHMVVFEVNETAGTELSETPKNLINNIIAKILLKESSPIMSTKFCLELDKMSDDSKCLLLWVMDQNLMRFHVSKEVWENCKIELQPKSVIKVLYCLVNPNSDKCNLWKKTFECEVEKVNKETLWDAVEFLQKSTETVPESQRVIDDFVVGFFNQP